MNLNLETLKHILVEPGHITEDDLSDIFKKSEAERQSPLMLLVNSGTITEDHLWELIADWEKKPFIQLEHESISFETLRIIPEAVAQKHRIIAYRENETTLFVATTEYQNYELIKFIEKKSGKSLEIAYTTPKGIKEALHKYQGDLQGRVKKLVDSIDQGLHDDSEVIKLVNMIMEYAYTMNTSDIHIEPLEKTAVVRVRIDGVLHEVVVYPKPLHEMVVSRLKIMSRLRIDERAATQDGRFEYQTTLAKFDVRVSIVPTTHGENVVMRLLTADAERHTQLEELGYSHEKAEVLRRAIQKPYGMILSVGPTGSGKSTTLYTLLQMLNRPEVNIMTIEDPVEFNIEHIQQIPVNLKKNVTFSTGLRSIVRQDPDIVMVGEIRDSETANISVNAAMTGHLVLSTLHSNDAATTFPRLIDMDVEPFLVASSVNVVIAQRLVRKICNKCRASYFISAEEKMVIELSPEMLAKINTLSNNKKLEEILLYHGAGCNDCGHTGYTGRVGIFEIFEINQDIRSLVIQKSSADVIQNKAREQGMESMEDDGIDKVFQGITTLAEVIRVTKSQ